MNDLQQTSKSQENYFTSLRSNGKRVHKADAQAPPLLEIFA